MRVEDLKVSIEVKGPKLFIWKILRLAFLKVRIVGVTKWRRGIIFSALAGRFYKEVWF